MLTGKFQRKYRKPGTGTTVFIYQVSGNEKELQQLEEAQGDQYRLDENSGKPLFFTTNYIDDNISLIITENNKVVADDSEIAKLASIVGQYGADVAKLLLMKKSVATAE